MDKEQNLKNENIPIVTIHDGEKVLLQLEGSHTTSTATETFLTAHKKNVKFRNERELEIKRDIQIKEKISQEAEQNLSENNLEEAIYSVTDYQKPQLTAQLGPSYCIAGFSSFKEISEKQENIELKNFKKVNEEKASQTYSIFTATSSFDFKNIACQTQLPDQISLNELSLMEISSLASRYEQPNSLNNYAQAENACVSYHGSKQETIKQPLVDTFVQENLTTHVVIEEPTITPSFNIITIEANSTPSSTDLRRPPFCHRVWDLFCNFCAAIFLFLQVNRDCIFCLAFFAAFVVSASFLTAFFYHTLVMSPALWQTIEDSPF